MSVGAEQVLGALIAYAKDLPREYYYRLLNVLNQLKEPLMQNLENNISEDFDSKIYILSMTMEAIVTLKSISALLGNCKSGNLM